MNYYVTTRLAEQRLQQTARQARTAWWRSQPVRRQKPQAPARRPSLDWVVPAPAQTTGA